MKRSTVLACVAAATFVSVEAAADERYFGREVPRQRPAVFEPAVMAAILPLVATNPCRDRQPHYVNRLLKDA